MSQWTSILRRRGVLPILGTALIAIVGVGALGRTSQVAQSSVHDPDYPPPYDNSRADQTLKAFDDGHPKCALWTDWRKLCSRTGPNGSTYCRVDVLHPAKPSAPFCVKDFSSSKQSYSQAERLSRMRFSHVASNHADEGPKYFAKYDPNRPFSGRTIYSLEHPYCAVWLRADARGRQAFCAEDGRKGMPSCTDSQTRYGVGAAGSFYPVCYEAVQGRACDPSKTVMPDDDSQGEDLAGNPYDQSIVSAFHPGWDVPVFGHYCPIKELP